MEESGRKHGLPGNLFLLFDFFPSSPAVKKPFLSCDLHGLLHAPAKCSCRARQATTPALHFVIASGAVTNTRRARHSRFTAQTKYEIRRRVFHAWPLSDSSCQPEIQCPFSWIQFRRCWGYTIETTQHLLSGVWTTLARQVRTRKKKKQKHEGGKCAEIMI